MQWNEIGIENILTAKNGQDVSYLKLFLIDYASAFNENNLCASCTTNIRNYYINYCKKFYQMKNESGYILDAQYENIPCGFGGDYVNNQNITVQKAKILLEHYGKSIFQSMPEVDVEKKEVPVKKKDESTSEKKTENIVVDADIVTSKK